MFTQVCTKYKTIFLGVNISINGARSTFQYKFISWLYLKLITFPQARNKTKQKAKQKRGTQNKTKSKTKTMQSE